MQRDFLIVASRVEANNRGCVSRRILFLFFVSWTSGALNLVASAAETRAGFYEISPECRDEIGTTVFLNRDSGESAISDPVVRARGKNGEVPISFTESGEARLISKSGQTCGLTFVSSSMKVLGVCSAFQSHRGDARKYPANSIEAFESALDQGFSGFELDVQLSQDQVLMVSHDDHLRVATDCRSRISELTVEEIQSCTLKRSGLLPEARFLSKKSKRTAQIPALGEVFQRFRNDPRAQNIMIDIKLKNRPRELTRAMVNAMHGFSEAERASLEKRITFIAKDIGTQAALRDVFPNAHIAYESDDSISGVVDKSGQDFITDAQCYDTYSLNVGADYNWMFGVLKVIKEKRIFGWRSFKSFMKKNQSSHQPRRILGWTLNHKKSIKHLRSLPMIDDVLTDFSMGKILEILYPEVTDDEIRENIQRLRTVGEEKFCQNDEGEKGE